MERRRGYWDGTEVVPVGEQRTEAGGRKTARRRAQFRIDESIQYGEHPNDFDRWLEEQREQRRECVGG